MKLIVGCRNSASFMDCKLMSNDWKRQIEASAYVCSTYYVRRYVRTYVLVMFYYDGTVLCRAMH